MFESRLIERTLRGGDAAVARADPSAVLTDVLAHLRELFNIRQGAIPTRQDYGMPDINGLINRFPDAIEELRRAITEQIRRFEPRLEVIAVRHEANPDNPLTLAFSIQAELVLEDRRQRVVFATAVHDDGAVTLSA
jgi:type VI secretion system protein